MIQRAPEPMLPRPFKVERVARETPDTHTMEISPADGGPGIRFLPGQFNMLYLFGVGEVPISISGDPADSAVTVHTTRAVGAVSRAITELKPGGTLGVRGPFGTPWPVREAVGGDVLIVAGGIGLAPLRPSILHVLAHRRDYRRVVLMYGARTPADILYQGQLSKWRSKFDMEVHVTADRSIGPWRGDVGVVTRFFHRVQLDALKTVAMVCGPEIMMRFTLAELDRQVIPPQRVYLSMERNMKCGVGLCGHCQIGPHFVCQDGPVYRADHIRSLAAVEEI
ncbi:MAG: FAD/NAD(P)-binding protein [Candidatus Eisenbacteria bacterium]|nr:FAD/NAD(P)-binding protein [Candidatus Eisenbacteria bacterium]